VHREGILEQDKLVVGMVVRIPVLGILEVGKDPSHILLIKFQNLSCSVRIVEQSRINLSYSWYGVKTCRSSVELEPLFKLYAHNHQMYHLRVEKKFIFLQIRLRKLNCLHFMSGKCKCYSATNN
jgi:predicted deacetylase